MTNYDINYIISLKTDKKGTINLMDLFNALNIINKIAVILIIISLILFSYRLLYIFFGFKKCKRFKNTNKKGKYAILVPARDESSVIEKLLISIKNQTYDKNFFDVYVITENEDDPTNSITKNYGYNYFVRKDLENKRTKGYALDEVIKDIYSKNIKYDAFFIIDADNTISKNYLEEMNKAYFANIDVCMSYKNVSNIDDNWISCCSSLLFCNINTFQNKAKTRLYNTMLISGTGLYISSKIIDEFKGFPFTTLTEDYELSNYIAHNKFNVAYIDTAEVFVEQPVKLSTVNKQRIRWCRGYFDVNKKLNKDTHKALHKKGSNKLGILENKLSLIPNVVAIVTMILYSLALVVVATIALITKNFDALEMSLICLLRFLLVYHLSLSLYTVLLFIAEKDHINVNKKLILLTIILNPFFINLFIYQAVVALFSKNIGWKKIERVDEMVVPTENTESEILDEDSVKIGVKNG